jgi:hypothetical protein
VNYYVFQVSDQSLYGKQRTAQEVFDFLVKGKSAWGFGLYTPNRRAIQPGDKVLFYLTGTENQVFVGSATLKTGTYEDKTGQSKEWYIDPNTLRIDLQDVIVFPEPRPRKGFKSLVWRPAQGGSSKISEKDFLVVLGTTPDVPKKIENSDEEMEFALEKYLEDFIVENWGKIDFGEKLEIFEDEDGNRGKQYFTEDAGYIDILAKDQRGHFVVIELKKGRKNDEVVGQVLRYMGWVRQHLVKQEEDVRGLIIVRDKDAKLEYAVREISTKVQIKRYSVSFRLVAY